ncbi:MAG: hypothetical protein ACJ8FY_04985 [Gemmataceae bacterium]
MYCHVPEGMDGPVSASRGGWMHSYSRKQPSDNPTANGRVPSQEPIRTELVERVRKEIASGTYDTPEKMDTALERLFRIVLES